MAESTSLQALRKGLLACLDGDHATAEAAYRLALTDPALAASARYHLIRLLEAVGRWDDALAERQAECIAKPNDAEAAQSLGMALLAAGRYREGWALFEARKALPSVHRYLPRVAYPEWDGRPVESLTVWDEQGVGDALQMARFLPQIAAQGAEVTFVCRPALVDLMSCLGVRIVPANTPDRIPQAQAWSMLASLPHRLGVTPETLDGAPYLRAPDAKREAWGPRIGPGARLGIMPRGNPGHVNDAHRSLPSEAGAFLLSLPGAFALDPDLGPLPLKDFADTAAVIERLPLVITVDTSVAHLAGALGKPCWILLPHRATDWRWMRDRRDTPWYRSATLYRQPKAGDWAAVLRQVAEDLPRFFAQA